MSAWHNVWSREMETELQLKLESTGTHTHTHTQIIGDSFAQGERKRGRGEGKGWKESWIYACDSPLRSSVSQWRRSRQNETTGKEE